MAAFPLFPYLNRQLGTQQMLTSKEACMDFSVLATICLANLQAQEQIAFEGEMLIVHRIDETAVAFTNGLEVPAAELAHSALHQHVVKTLQQAIPGYTHPLVAVLERDPAVFRLRTGAGWVVNDALCLMSGNVQYTVATTDTSPVDVQEPSVTQKEPITAPPPAPEHTPGKSASEKAQLSLF